MKIVCSFFFLKPNFNRLSKVNLYIQQTHRKRTYKLNRSRLMSAFYLLETFSRIRYSLDEARGGETIQLELQVFEHTYQEERGMSTVHKIFKF